MTHGVAKNRRADLHRPNFVDDNKAPCVDGVTNRLDADFFERGQVETVFPEPLRCCEIDMGEYRLITIERRDLESDPYAVLSNLLCIKATATLG